MVDRTLTPTVLDVLSVACADFENGTRTAAQMLALDPDYVAKCAVVDAYRSGGGGGADYGVDGVGVRTSVVATSWDIEVPAPSEGDGAGDMLLIFVNINWAKPDITVTGFTKLADIDISDSLGRLYYRECDGTEDTTVACTSPQNTSYVSTAYRVKRGTTGAPEYSATIAGVTQIGSAPILTPSWGEKQTLWIHFIFESVSYHWTVPTDDYANELEHYTLNYLDNFPAVITSYKVATLASDNPGNTTNDSPGGVWNRIGTLAVQLAA